MKKLKICLLLLVLAVGCLVLAGCNSKVDITNSISVEESSESFTSRGHVWNITYYVSESKLDLRTVDKIEIKINGKKLTPTYIDRENNCFSVEYVDPEYNAVNAHVDKCRAFVSSERKEAVENEGKDSEEISIFNTILLCLAGTAVSLFIYWIALGQYMFRLMYAMHLICIIATFGMYVTFGTVRGIIATVFLGIYIISAEGIIKRFVDNG